MQRLVKQLLFGGIAGKVLGVLRELVAAWCFGTGLVANAYRLAQAAFLLPLHGFVSDVISGAFTPRYARLRVEDPAQAQRLFAAMQWVLLVVSVVVAGGLVIWGQHLVSLMAPGFSPEARAMSTEFVRVLAPALPAYVLVGFYGGTELVHGTGRLLSARASVQSAGLLIGTLAAWALDRPILIAVGFVISYFALLFWAIRISRGIGIKLTAPVGILRVWITVLLPVAKTFSVLLWVPVFLLISQIVERRVASQVDGNAIAALDYARFITETMLVVIAMPFGIAGQAAMPTMGVDQFRHEAIRSLRTLVLVSLPISAFIWSEARWLVEVTFMRGAFTAQSVAVTADILSALSLGLAFLLVNYTAQKFLNARGQNYSVLWVSLIGSLLTITVNLGFHEKLGVAVLGFASAFAAAVSATLTCYLLGILKEIWKSSSLFLLAFFLHVSLVLVARVLPNGGPGLDTAIGIIVWVALFVFFKSARRSLFDGLSLLRKKQL